MLNKRGSILIAAIGTILCFLSVSYMSCTKVGPSPTCNGVICENGGYCDHGLCVCPNGFEGANCGTASVAKFLRTWDVKQTVTGSDSAYVIGKDSLYSMSFQVSATPTTFLIFGFLGDSYYNNVVCVLDSLNSNVFSLDTNRSVNMNFDHLVIEPTSGGTYDPATSTINANLVIKHINHSSNWQRDTLTLKLTPHHI